MSKNRIIKQLLELQNHKLISDIVLNKSNNSNYTYNSKYIHYSEYITIIIDIPYDYPFKPVLFGINGNLYYIYKKIINKYLYNYNISDDLIAYIYNFIPIHFDNHLEFKNIKQFILNYVNDYNQYNKKYMNTNVIFDYDDLIVNNNIIDTIYIRYNKLISYLTKLDIL